VIQVQVRLYDVAYGSRIYIYPLELVDDEIVLVHHGIVGVDDVSPVPAGVPGHLQGVAAIVEYVAAGVGDQIERNRYLVRVTEPLVHLDELHLRLEAAALEK
jgi:hypothetical protein